MAKLDLLNINKIYDTGDAQAHIIKDANLAIAEGEFVVFVGPSGCGKSTMLRMIAGLEDITSGELRFNDDLVNQLSPSERGIGMVFQSYALYPHMTVRENIAFGVKYTRNWDKKQVNQAVTDIAQALELTHLLDHKPSQMSGGQRQRVAIGRALIRQPSVFLLDEPLSNLDAALRVRMRMQIAKFHQQFNSTTIYVTHDQVEAMTLADKVVILNKGRIEQVGSPLDLYHFPASIFVAEFIGSPKMNVVPVTYLGSNNGPAEVALNNSKVYVAADCSQLQPGATLQLGIRPEDIRLKQAQTQEQASATLSVQVQERELLGAESVLYTQLGKITSEFLVRTPGTLKVSNQLNITLPASACHLFDESGNALPRLLTPEQLYTEYTQATSA